MPCLSSKYHKGIGPLIQVVITSIDQDKTSKSKYNALIDTGADGTCVSEKVVKDLELNPNGQIKMSGPSGIKDTFVYDVSFGLVLTSSLTQDLVAMSKVSLQVTQVFLPKKGYDVLLGKDILCKGCFYMSNDGHFSFSF